MDKELVPVLDLNGKEIKVKGYYVEDIKQYLTNVEFMDFLKFMTGQTVGIINNKQLVYKHDYDRWRNQYDKCKTLN